MELGEQRAYITLLLEAGTHAGIERKEARRAANGPITTFFVIGQKRSRLHNVEHHILLEHTAVCPPSHADMPLQ